MKNNCLTGVVIFFKNGYGFIKPDDGSLDIFVHFSDILIDGFRTLQKNQRVEYEVGTNKKGQPKAINVKLINV